MSMNKHGNTYFPDETVYVHSKDKTASRQTAQVVDVDPGMELATVRFTDGRVEQRDLALLEKLE